MIGGVAVGGAAPIVVQSMTNTDTADADATASQVAALARAGSELVRVTVNSPEAAAQVAGIRATLDGQGVLVPLIGDFHLQRPPPADSVPGLRPGAGQVPHQPGQRRARRASATSSSPP